MVGLGDLLEFGFGLRLVVRVLVRVPLHGELSVGFLEVVVVGVAVDLQGPVVVHPHQYSLLSPSDSD